MVVYATHKFDPLSQTCFRCRRHRPSDLTHRCRCLCNFTNYRPRSWYCLRRVVSHSGLETSDAAIDQVNLFLESSGVNDLDSNHRIIEFTVGWTLVADVRFAPLEVPLKTAGRCNVAMTRRRRDAAPLLGSALLRIESPIRRRDF